MAESFLEIYTSIEQSKQRVENARERLKECKNLLLLKRQEITKLWLLTSEQNTLVRIYDNLHELRQLPSRLDFYRNKHLYLHASLLLLKSREFQELRMINALTEIDARIKEERFALEDHLCSELIHHLFEKPSKDILTAKDFTGNRSGKYSSLRLRENRLLRKQFDQEFDEGKLSLESSFLSIIPDKYLLTDVLLQSPELYFEVLIQSLAILSHLNETLEYIQRKLQEQCYRIILRTTQHILDSHFPLITNHPEYLRTLLEFSYEQFKLVMKNCQLILHHLRLLQERKSPVQVRQEEFRQSQKQFGLSFFLASAERLTNRLAIRC